MLILTSPFVSAVKLQSIPNLHLSVVGIAR